MDESGKALQLVKIVSQLQQQFVQFLSHSTQIPFVEPAKEQEISSFSKSEYKVLLALSKDSDLISVYFKHLADRLWKQEQPRNIIPLYIELFQLC